MRDIYEYTDNFAKYQHVKSAPVISGKIDNPKITILIPTYKRPQTLRDSIASALNQKMNAGMPEYEIVIMNDSPDEDGSTAELVRSFHSDRIYFFVNERNIGMFGNWNRGVELARGEYVVMLHDDDVLSPYYLEALTTAIREKDHPAVIGTSHYDFQDIASLNFAPLPQKLAYRQITCLQKFFGQAVSICGVAVRKDVYFKLGGYNDEYYPNADYIFIYKIVASGERALNIEHKSAGYRVSENTSLKPGTMKKIILMTEHMRRNIAEHETFARVFMKLFDREYLYSFVIGANNCWHLNIDPGEILREFGMNTDTPSRAKMKLMNFIRRAALKLSKMGLF